MAPDSPVANDGKALEVVVDGRRYERIPLKTRVLMLGDELDSFVTEYTAGACRPGDWLFVTEKIVAIAQGRSYPMSEITARPLARVLSRYVTKTSHGIGLGIPETMEFALRECGIPRILFAAAVSAVTKRMGRKGDFYRIAGPAARGIDGPTEHTIPPYNTHVVLVPERPREVAAHLKALLHGVPEVLIVDINDFGGNILGSTLVPADERLAVRILQDNPLGQKRESTPLGIIRPVV